MGWFGYAPFDVFPFMEYLLFRLVDTLFTGLIVVAVIAFTVRVLKVRAVSVRIEKCDECRGEKIRGGP